jgi:hypothetical protein
VKGRLRPSSRAAGGDSGATGSEDAALDSRLRGNERSKTNERDDAAADAEKERQEAIACRRWLHTGLGFWRVCRENRCKRARGCAGDVYACAARHFPLMPEETKAYLQKVFEGLRNGLTADEAHQAARKHVAEIEAMLARIAQYEAELQAARAAPVAHNPVQCHAPDSAPMPAAPPPVRTLAPIFAPRDIFRRPRG